MIDVESDIFSLISTALRAAYDDIYVTGEYVSQPPIFPAVFIVEMENSVYQPGRDSSGIENFANVMYQIDVYSNLSRGKKAQARTIIGMIDVLMAVKGFTRTFMNPVQNMNDPTIYRITARYQAVVGKDKVIYNRR